jgi:hypothetical protein
VTSVPAAGAPITNPITNLKGARMSPYDEQGKTRQNEEGEVFDRQYMVYKESLEQRGESEDEAGEEAAAKLETPVGERGGAHSDRQ